MLDAALPHPAGGRVTSLTLLDAARLPISCWTPSGSLHPDPSRVNVRILVDAVKFLANCWTPRDFRNLRDAAWLHTLLDTA